MGGWRLSPSPAAAPTYSAYITEYGSCGPGQEQLPTQETFWSFAWTDPQGTNHAFDAGFYQQLPIPCDPNQQPAGTVGYALDGSGYYMTAVYDPDTQGVDTAVYDRQGNQIYPMLQDTNGNYMSSDSNGNLVDTLGRTPVLTSTSGNQIYYDVLSNSGAPRLRYTVTTETVNFWTFFNQLPVNDVHGSFTAIQSIQLPDGSSYSFTYDSYGELNSVTLPTGGVIQYTYQNFFDSFNNNNRWLYQRIKDGGTTTFTPETISLCTSSTGCQEKTTVTSPDANNPSGNDTVYTFTLDPGSVSNGSSWNAGITAYQGTSSGGTPLKGVSTSYTYGTISVASPSGNLNYTVPQSATVVTSLSDVGLTSKNVTSFDSIGANPANIQQWDYYSGSAPSAPTIQTNYTYGYSVNGASLPTQISVTDGSGNPISQTIYGYDEATGTGHAALAPVSGLPQNPLTVSGARGNLTTTSQWINTSGAWLSTAATYDAAGTLLTKTDPNGTTTYGHDNSDTLTTSTALPVPSSGVQLTTSAAYDPQSGVQLSTTGMNGDQTQITQFDSLLRPAVVSYPDGGQTNYYFTDVNTFWTDHPLNGTTPAHFVTHTDGYNRLDRTALFTGNDWYQIDYCFDVSGLLQFQSARYEGSGFSGPNANKQCSGNGISYAHDALGRITSNTNADGAASSQYRGRSVLATDVNGVQKIASQDAFGRTSDICEVSSSTLQGESPQTCPGDIGGYTGFVTHYDYDLPNHKTTITQGVQQRVFQTDSVGRSIYTREPERGVTTYSYTYNSTGLVVTRKRPRANQTDPNVLTTTTTQYDAVGRVTSISYDDGTLTKNFGYDATFSGWAILPTLTNGKGNLSLAWVQTPNVWAATLFSYDPMGRVNAMAQCVPSGCGNSPFDKRMDYVYDLDGNLTSSSDGAGVTTYYTYSPASEVQTITSSLNDATHPGTLVSNVQNGPNGPLGYSLGNGLTNVTTRDTLGRMNGGSFCSGSNAFYCIGGTAVYWFTNTWKGVRSLGQCDTGFNQCLDYGYDEFNRLASRSSSGNTEFTYVYDRYGNRWQQNAFLGGPMPQLSFNTATNQISGYAYDAAGNALTDGINSYQYDAEGNLIQANTGSATFQYTYNALNQQVRFDYNSSTFSTYVESIFNAQGKFSANWSQGNILTSAEAYWGSTPIESYFGWPSLTAHFLLRDALGSMRFETDNTGAVTVNRYTLEFGDGTRAVSGSRNTNDGFAGMPDSPSGNHAQFRDYSNVTGRWLQPDPYDGSYNLSYPQTLNRYAYVGNNPLGYTDPTGLDGNPIGGNPVGGIGGCLGVAISEGANPIADIGCGISLLSDIFNFFSKPSFNGSLKPRPNSGQIWHDTYSVPYGGLTNGITGALGLPDAGCEFGTCGTGSMGLISGIGSSSSNSVLLSVANYAALFFGPIQYPCQSGNCKYSIYYGKNPFGNVCSAVHKTDGSAATVYSLWDCIGDLSSCKANARKFQNDCRDQGQVPLDCQNGFTGQGSGGSFYYCPCCDYGKKP